MAAPLQIDEWSTEDLQSFLTAAANARDGGGKQIWVIISGLEKVLTVIKSQSLHGRMIEGLQHQDFLKDEAGLSYGERAHFKVLFEDLMQRTDDTFARVSRSTAWRAPTARATTPIEPAQSRQVEQIAGKKRKRAVLTVVEAPTPPPLSNGAYLPYDAFNVDDLFYDGTKVGEWFTIRDDLEKSFGFYDLPVPVRGTQQFVCRRMLYFLRDKPIVQLSNSTAYVRQCYSFNVKATPSATMYSVTPRTDEARRVQLLKTANGIQSLESDCAVGDDLTDMLRRWPDRPMEEDLVSIGTVSSQMEVDTETSTDEDDMAEEEQEELESNLSAEQMKGIIEHETKKFADAWKPKKAPFTIWNMRGQRADLIARSEREIDRLEERLNAYIEDIMVHCRDAKDCARQCETLQVTIEDIEQERWKIGIWSGDRPDRPDKTAAKGKRTARLTGGFGQRHSIPDRLTPQSDALTAPAAELVEPMTAGEPAPPAIATEPVDLRDEDADSDTSMRDFVVPDDEIVSTVPVHTAKSKSSAAQPSSQVNDARNETPEAPSPPVKTEQKHTPRTAVPKLDTTPSVISISDDSRNPTPVKSTPKKSFGLFGGIPHTPALLSDDEEEADHRPKRRKVDDNSPSEIQARRSQHDRIKDKDLDFMTATDLGHLDLQALFTDKAHDKSLAKMLFDAGPEYRRQLATILNGCRGTVSQLVQSALSDLGGDSPVLHLDDLTEEEQGIMLRCARIALAFYTSRSSPLDSNDVSDLPGFLKDGDQIEIFINTLERLLPQYQLFDSPQAIVVDSDEADISSEPDTTSESDVPLPKKATKAQIQRAARQNTSKQVRRSAQERHDRFMQHSQSDPKALSQLASQSDVRVQINFDPENEPEPIYINDGIAGSLKVHQLEGVRFLWRELTVQDSGTICGGLLAHSMGLGKTMQSLTVLLAITDAARSEDRNISRQLPKSLRHKEVAKGERHLRILLLMPPALIENWKNEISRWNVQQQLGDLFTMNNDLPHERAKTIEEWFKDGGLLLVGYEMFRDIMLGRGKQESAASELSPSASILTQETDIVVADEAHAFKNPTSKISKAVKMLRCKHRVALTGTPLSNDIDEVFELISWVCPNYLGSHADFLHKFANPIKEGLYQDSDKAAIRKSKKKLAVLRNETEPKCHRRGIEVLADVLPKKTEFILTVSHTAHQRTAYACFIEALGAQIDGARAKVSQVQLFSWLNAMTLLLNHPWMLHKKLTTPPNPKPMPKLAASTKESEQSDATTDSAELPKDTGLQKVDIDELLVHGLTEAKRAQLVTDASLTNDLDPGLSAKTALFVDIVKHSLAAGDSILVFTGTLLTLDYLSELLGQQDIPSQRIEGKVKHQHRMSIIDGLGKDYSVLLVSTRAGAYGYNVQVANRVVIFDSGFNPAHEEQAVARAYRFGQKKPVYVYRFVCGGTFEVNMENTQLFKAALAQQVVDKKNVMRNALRNIKDWLFVPDPVEEQGNIMEWHGKDAVLDRILEAQQDGHAGNKRIYAIRTMETLQADDHDADLDELERKEVNDEIAERRSTRLSNRMAPLGSNEQQRPPLATPKPRTNGLLAQPSQAF